ncbi:MAG TPA: glycosyltransferase [Acidimicrobiales bacterium]|nr:glycosyltransferase [Acidimicrobiales bacterium]
MSGAGGTPAALDASASDSVGVAIEVSALGGGHTASEFVEFAMAALEGAADVELRAWSVRRLRSSSSGGITLRRSARGWLGERAARLGVPISTSWASPPAEVIFEASGPLSLRACAPGVLSVHEFDRAGDTSSRRRRRGRLRRAADDGVVLHVMTSAHADALVDELGVSRAAIAVAAPGVRPARSSPAGPALGAAQIVVLRGSNPSGDQAVLERLRAAGATVELASSPPASPCSCCVLATPDDGFPLVAFEALAAGTAVVVTRTPTTTELLEGAATLVDADSTQDVVDAAMELCANDAARAIAVAAGRARADDFSWARRATALVGVVRRSVVRP